MSPEHRALMIDAQKWVDFEDAIVEIEHDLYETSSQNDTFDDLHDLVVVALWEARKVLWQNESKLMDKILEQFETPQMQTFLKLGGWDPEWDAYDEVISRWHLVKIPRK